MVILPIVLTNGIGHIIGNFIDKNITKQPSYFSYWDKDGIFTTIISRMGILLGLYLYSLPNIMYYNFILGITLGILIGPFLPEHYYTSYEFRDELYQ